MTNKKNSFGIIIEYSAKGKHDKFQLTTPKFYYLFLILNFA